MESGLIGSLKLPIHKVVGIEDRTDRNIGGQAKSAIETPLLSAIHIIDALHREAKVVDGLQLVDSISVKAHLILRLQMAVSQSCLYSKAIV